MDEPTQSPIAIYQADDGGQTTEVRLEGESAWLTQRQMAELFATTPENVLMHLRNIYREGELQEETTTKDFLVVREEGRRKVQRRLKHYHLDAIISVGYGVNSRQGTRFRIWANQVLKDYLVQGYALNEQRLKAQQARVRELERTLFHDQASLPEARGLVSVIAGYARTLVATSNTTTNRRSTTMPWLPSHCSWRRA